MFWPILGHFLCSVETLVTVISQFNTFKIPKNPKNAGAPSKPHTPSISTKYSPHLLCKAVPNCKESTFHKSLTVNFSGKSIVVQRKLAITFQQGGTAPPWIFDISDLAQTQPNQTKLGSLKLGTPVPKRCGQDFLEMKRVFEYA